ncbi:MAG: heme biosynthesis protein HemY [Acidiferrobacterales bacterium]
MKTLALILLVLFVSVLVTLFAIEDPGYVLITRTPWSIEMPLTLFVLLLIVGAIVVQIVWRLLRRTWNIPRDVATWRLDRNTRKARLALMRGLIRLAEGDWARARAQLLSGLQYGETPLLNYLGAACASQAMGDTEKRDEFVSEAQKAAPNGSLAIAMTQAHLYSWTEQHEQALAALSELRAQEPKHGHVLRLLVKTYLALGDWTSVAELIPKLRKNKLLSPEAIDALELQAHRELLHLSLPSGSLEVLKRAWHAVPKALRRNPKLVGIYSSHLIEQNRMSEAESLLRESISREWNDELAELFGRVSSDNPAAQLETAEHWLQSHPDNPSLLLTVGRLSLRNELWGKARSYLETSLKRRPTLQVYRELGALMERLGESDKALDYYRRSLESLVAEKPALPAATTKTLAQPRQAAS